MAWPEGPLEPSKAFYSTVLHEVHLRAVRRHSVGTPAVEREVRQTADRLIGFGEVQHGAALGRDVPEHEGLGPPRDVDEDPEQLQLREVVEHHARRFSVVDVVLTESISLALEPHPVDRPTVVESVWGDSDDLGVQPPDPPQVSPEVLELGVVRLEAGAEFRRPVAVVRIAGKFLEVDAVVALKLCRELQADPVEDHAVLQDHPAHHATGVRPDGGQEAILISLLSIVANEKVAIDFTEDRVVPPHPHVGEAGFGGGVGIFFTDGRELRPIRQGEGTQGKLGADHD